VHSTAALRGATVILDDRPIIRAMTLDVRVGVTVVRGPNASGKTTLLRALAGLLPLASGERDVSATTLYVGHRPQLLRGLSARDNLRFLAAFRGVSQDNVGPALSSWGLTSRDASRPVEALSVGQRRRAALARIDVERCDLVLLDEPFGELDDAAHARLTAAIRVLAGERRRVVIATHGHPELDQSATEIVRLG
jgi:heme exporter protein A